MNCSRQKLTPPEAVVSTSKYLRLYNILAKFFQKNDYADFASEIVEIDDEQSYQALYTKITTYITNLGLVNLRIVLADPDGKVIVDTSKGEDNNYQNYLDGSINANHNTRQTFMSAQTFKEGISYETKYSNSTQQVRAYVSMRIGNFRDNSGTICASLPSSLGEVVTAAPTPIRKQC